MAYISSKCAESGAVTASDSATWTTLCETAGTAVTSGNIFRVKAGWRSTVGATGGSIRVVINDGSTDTVLGSAYSVSAGTEVRTVTKQSTTVAGTWTAKIQAKPAALSSVAVAAEDAWIELFYLTT